MAFKMKGYPLRNESLPTEDGDPKAVKSERYLKSDAYQAKEIKGLRDDVGIPDLSNSPNTSHSPRRQDFEFVKTTNKAGNDALDKIALLPTEEYEQLKSDLIETAKPFINTKSDGSTLDSLRTTLKVTNAVKDLDLSGYKKYLDSAGITLDDIKGIISAHISTLPDENDIPGPDMFEGYSGKALKVVVDKVIAMKLKDLS